MKKLLLLLLPLSLILTSCGPDPIKYNDSLVDYYKIAQNRLTKFIDIASEDMDSGDFSNLKEHATTTTDSLKLDIDKINKLDKPSGSEEFHNSMISCMDALISYVNTIGDQYSQVTDSTTDKEFEDMDNAVNKSLEVSELKDKEMIEAQKKFAKLKKFDLK